MATNDGRYSHFNAEVFRSSVDGALKTVEKILESNRKPRKAEDVDHSYENKYELADQMTNLAIIAQMNVLEKFGLTLEKLLQVDQSQSTTIRFHASETCNFLKEQTVEVPMDTYHQETIEENRSKQGKSYFGSTSKSTIQKVIKRVKEYHWTVESRWEISIFAGTNVSQKTILQSRDSSMIVVTQSKRAPVQQLLEHDPADLSLTWLLQQIDLETKTAKFHILSETAKTPRRNEQVKDAIGFFKGIKEWLSSVRFHFIITLEQNIVGMNNPVYASKVPVTTMIKSCSASGIFLPILPLLDTTIDDSFDLSLDATTEVRRSNLALTSEAVGPLLPQEDYTKLLNEQIRSIEEKIQSLQRAFPAAVLVKLFSVAEATLVVLSEHSLYLSHQYQEAIDYMEKLLESQLVKAIGKRVTIADLEEFIRFYNARFLNPPPRPFSHVIGRPNHYPFGVLSIESPRDDDKMEPIETIARQISQSSLKVALDATTSVDLTGNTFLHGWMNYRCQQASNKAYQLRARARQFSSFLLVVGTMMGPDQLQPKDAIILQNKDEVIIPLLLNELPSAKEFKDAIQSLSPEQRRFAESFRSMQLESSVFGVCVVQIKPQLETLLGLPEDSLAKEIKLSEDLMQLFVEYQVPSDLLSFNGDTTVTMKEKVDNVREHVQAVFDVIDNTKEKQLEHSTMEADMAIELAGGPPPPRRGPPRGSLTRYNKGSGPVPQLGHVDDDGPSRRIGGRSALSSSTAMSAPRQMMASEAPMPPHAPPQASPPLPQTVFPPASTETVLSTPQKAEASTPPDDSTPTDFIAMPKVLDASIEKYDQDGSLRSTVIKTSDQWSRIRQPNLLAKPYTETLYSASVQSEKNKAFDLLDALSRSGSLPIPYSDLHVILCATHYFENSIMDTAIQDNINPIERLELSTLLLGSTIHGKAPQELICEDGQRNRLESSFPALLLE